MEPTDCVLLCKYLSTYFFLSHIPTHKWKLNFYLPLPIPFQMYLSRVRVQRMPPFDASASHFNCTLLVLLCKYLSNYFLLNHLTHPHLESNLVLTLSYSISDVLRRCIVRVRRMPPFDASASHFNCTLLVLLCKYLSNYFLLNHFTLFYQHDWHIKEY